MGEPSYEIPPVEKPLEKPPEKRLDSWKEIAVYLNRDVTTVQRWEKREGMPVHRHVHDKRGSVYALTEELDDWIQSRRLRAGDEIFCDPSSILGSIGVVGGSFGPQVVQRGANARDQHLDIRPRTQVAGRNRRAFVS